jgi:hypothetical protein
MYQGGTLASFDLETGLGLARGASVNMGFLFRLLQIVNKKKEQRI